MKAFRDWLTEHATLLTEAIRQIILVLMIFGLLQWTDQQVAAVLMAISAVMQLFVRQTQIPETHIDRIVDKRMRGDRITEKRVRGEIANPPPDPRD